MLLSILYFIFENLKKKTFIDNLSITRKRVASLVRFCIVQLKICFVHLNDFYFYK